MTREEQIKSNAQEIMSMCRKVEALTTAHGVARIMFGLAFCESSCEWHRPMEELLQVKAAASDMGVWQITPIYRQDVDLYVFNAPSAYASLWGGTPIALTMDTLEGQAAYTRTYCHIYRRLLHDGLDDFWLLHHYGPSMKNRGGNMEETEKYFTNYSKGLEVFNAFNQVQGQSQQ